MRERGEADVDVLAGLVRPFGEWFREGDGYREEISSGQEFDICVDRGLIDVSLEDQKEVDAGCFENIHAKVGDV